MRSPKIALGSRWLHFDGIIAYLMLREKLGEDYWTLPSKDPIDISPYIKDPPVKKTGELWHASVAQFPEYAKVEYTTLYKRVDERYCHTIDTKIQKLRVDRGHFRAYMMNIPTIQTNKVSFYVNGDLDEIKRLLMHVSGLGKKTRAGCGYINRSKPLLVEGTPEDYSLIKDGVAMRPLPTSMGYRGSVLMWLPWHAPYWDKRNVTACIAPGAKIFGN
jgi:CRISPR type IV-associated protein Csf3